MPDYNGLYDEAKGLLSLIDDLIWRLQKRSIGVFDSVQDQLHAIVNSGIQDACETEAILDTLGWEVRFRWIEASRRSIERIAKSPPVYPDSLRSASQQNFFDYERFGASVQFEHRFERSEKSINGLEKRCLVFNSGMSSISAVHLACANLARTEFQTSLRVWHNAGYIESQALFSTLNSPDVNYVPIKEVEDRDFVGKPAVNLMHVEPISFGQNLDRFSEDDFVRLWNGHALFRENLPSVVLFDTTAVGSSWDLDTLVRRLTPPLPLVVNLRSGLKLHQQGMELANVGLVSCYFTEHGLVDHAFAETFVNKLRLIRQLNGAALTLSAVNALDAPFVLDSEKNDQHATVIFDQNHQLATAIKAGGLFASINYPQPIKKFGKDVATADCPVVLFQLSDKAPESTVFLIEFIRRESEKRKILFEQGASFGFRGHRYDAYCVDGQPVLRVAMGARVGPSTEKVISLLQTISACKSCQELGLL